MGLVEHEVDGLLFVGDRVADRLPDVPGEFVRCGNVVEDLVGGGHVAARQQRALRQSLGVEEVHLAALQRRNRKRRPDRDEVARDELLGCLHEPRATLLIQGRIVREPDDDRTWVGVELEGVAAVEQRLDRSGRHNRLAGAGCRGEAEGDFLAVAAEDAVRLFQVVQHLLDGFGLVVLEGVFHRSAALRASISKVLR